MEDLKIIAIVRTKTWDGYVLNRDIDLKYELLYGSSILVARDGPFYKAYQKGWMGGKGAFGGSLFDIPLKDGSGAIHAAGEWWDAGASKIAEMLKINLISAAVGTIPDLINCYVFCGLSADKDKLVKLLDGYSGPTYEYRDYEKIIKFDSMRRDFWKRERKLEKAKKSLIKEVRSKHQHLELIRNVAIENTWGKK